MSLVNNAIRSSGIFITSERSPTVGLCFPLFALHTLMRLNSYCPVFPKHLPKVHAQCILQSRSAVAMKYIQKHQKPSKTTAIINPHLRQQTIPPTKEPPNSHSRREHNSRKATSHHSRAEQHIHHLHPVAPPAAVHEPICIIRARELFALWHRHLEEVAQRFPPFAHLILEEVLLGHERAQFFVVFVEATLAVLLEVAFPELGPEFCDCLVSGHVHRLGGCKCNILLSIG